MEKRLITAAKAAFDYNEFIDEVFVNADGSCFVEKDDALKHAGCCDEGTEVYHALKGKEEDAVLIYPEATAKDDEDPADEDPANDNNGKSAAPKKAAAKKVATKK